MLSRENLLSFCLTRNLWFNFLFDIWFPKIRGYWNLDYFALFFVAFAHQICTPIDALFFIVNNMQSSKLSSGLMVCYSAFITEAKQFVKLTQLLLELHKLKIFGCYLRQNGVVKYNGLCSCPVKTMITYTLTL